MKFNIKHILLKILFIAFLVSQAHSEEPAPQSNTIVKNPEGREFWLCFMKNFKDDDRRQSKSNDLLLELFITGDKDANVKIEVKSIGYSQSVFVPGGTIKSVKVDQLAQIRSFEVIEQQQAVHITSDNPISVYGLNRRFQTTDTYLGLPVEVLGTEYRIMSYYVTDDLLSIFAVVATEDNTIIEIAPSVETYQGKKPNEPYKVTLNKGDVYQVAGKKMPKSDLTGSYIKSNKKVAVFGGHQCSYVPRISPEIIACNHLAEQLPPIHAWGKHFYIGKMKLRSKYTYRVVAHQPNTKVFENTNMVGVLNAGQFFEKNTSEDVQITADKPVLVAQYSQGFKNGDSIGDPMMLLISPTQQFLRKYRFATPVNGDWEHIINIVVPTSAINTVQLDGKAIDSAMFSTLGISRYSIAYISVPFGSHVIEGAMPFGMYSYGFGRGADAFDAYGTMGGQSFTEYEPVKDVNPPMAELREIADKPTLILRDDGRDDTGIKDIYIIDNNNIDFKQPHITESAPQFAIELKAINPSLEGRLALRVRDMALNATVITICYVYDQFDNAYRFKLHSGDDVKCAADLGITIGAFGKLAMNYHKADFSETGNIAALGKFSDASGVSGGFGALFSKNISNEWSATAKISIEKHVGTIVAADSIISNVRDIATGELKPFREQRNLSLNSYYSQFFVGIEYTLNHLFYLTAGLSADINFSKSIDYEKEIQIPNDFVYSNNKRKIKPDDFPNTLNSMLFARLGAVGGVGFSYTIYRRYSAFAELNYFYSLMDVVDDANWKINRLSLLLGLKYRL